MKNVFFKTALISCFCLLFLGTQVLAATPSQAIEQYETAYSDLKADAVIYLTELINTLAEDGTTSDEPVSFQQDRGYLSFSFTSMEGITPEMILNGTAQPHHVEMDFVCLNEKGELGRLSYISYPDGTIGHSCVMGLSEEELMLPTKEQLAYEVTQLIGSDIEEIVYVSTFDYGVTSFFLVSDSYEIHLIPYKLGWDTPQLQTISYFTSNNPESSYGHSLADPDEIFSFLEDLREAQIGEDENGNPLFGGAPQISISNGKPVVLTESSTAPTSTQSAPAQTWGLIAVLLLIFFGVGYSSLLFRRKT